MSSLLTLRILSKNGLVSEVFLLVARFSLVLLYFQLPLSYDGQIGK